MAYPITIKPDLRNGENCTVGVDSYTHAEGFETSATGKYAHSEGVSTTASGVGSHASGVNAVAAHKNSSVWNGDPSKTVSSTSDGTMVINPVGGTDGLFVGEKSLKSYLDDTKSVLEYATKDGFPSNGESGKVYMAADTNMTYRWNGEAYAETTAKGVKKADLSDLPEDYTPDVLRSTINAINACLRASMAAIAMMFYVFVPGNALADIDTDANSRVTIHELGDMSSMKKQFNALSELSEVVTGVDLEGLATEEGVQQKIDEEAKTRGDADEAMKSRLDSLESSMTNAVESISSVSNSVETIIEPTPSLTEEEVARGLTYEKNGILQNGAIQIGNNAIATIDPEYVKNAPSGTVLRSVSVAIGDYANARSDGKGQSQSVAIGWFSQAKGGNSIAIGSGAQHTNETAMSSGATVATGDCSIALGYTAKATANNSVQIGIGTNSTPNSLQFQDVTIVKNGKIALDVNTLTTNDVESIIMDFVNAYLTPRTIEEVPSDGVIVIKSHAITTLSPTNDTAALDEVVVESNASRNYEIYIPNVASTRISLPILFDTEDESLEKIGAWWTQKALRLPLLMKVREPKDKTVILDVDVYDDGWDWTPVITNAVWEMSSDGTVRNLKRVWGQNLHTVTEIQVAYEKTDGSTNVVVSSSVGNALYRMIDPTIDGIAESDIAEGTEVVVTPVAK